MLRFLIIIFFVLSKSAYSFPFMTTHGYASCSSCHVSPSGGGILTKYGKSQSGEILSTFNYKSIPDTPEWVDVGANIRWLNVTRDTNKVDSSKIFFMQTQGEIAVYPIKGLTLVASGGKYNEGDKMEFRRNYVLLNMGDHVSFRVGRFNADYGLFLADHTSYVHSGQGTETYNFEARARSRYFNISATAIGGEKRNLVATENDGYALDEGEDGYAIKADVFLFSKSSIGYSYQDYRGHKRGPFGIIDIFGAYLLYQYDLLHDSGTLFTELGREVYKGLHTTIGYQTKGKGQSKTDKYEAKINWFPVQHLELLFQYDYTTYNEYDFENQYMVMTHFYL